MPTTEPPGGPTGRQPFAPGGQPLPQRDRDAIRLAISHVNRAAGMVGVVRVRYPLSDAVGLELTELLARFDMLVLRGNQFLAVHPEQ